MSREGSRFVVILNRVTSVLKRDVTTGTNFIIVPFVPIAGEPLAKGGFFIALSFLSYCVEEAHSRTITLMILYYCLFKHYYIVHYLLCSYFEP